jgi:hypothetical protein
MGAFARTSGAKFESPQGKIRNPKIEIRNKSERGEKEEKAKKQKSRIDALNAFVRVAPGRFGFRI